MVESSINGGGGYTIQEVGDMTPYQIYFRLTEPELLKRQDGKRIVKMNQASAVTLADENNEVKVRMADGTVKKFSADGLANPKM